MGVFYQSPGGSRLFIYLEHLLGHEISLGAGSGGVVVLTRFFRLQEWILWLLLVAGCSSLVRGGDFWQHSQKIPQQDIRFGFGFLLSFAIKVPVDL